MVVVPAATAVTKPVTGLMVAAAVLLLVHDPAPPTGVETSVRVVVLPTQRFEVPEIVTEGGAMTLITDGTKEVEAQPFRVSEK